MNELKKDGFKWSTVVEKAFLQLKMAMSSILVLAFLDFTRPFILDTDASGHGLGVVLMLDQRPIAFFIHILSPKAHQRSIYERKLMVIVFVV